VIWQLRLKIPFYQSPSITVGFSQLYATGSNITTSEIIAIQSALSITVGFSQLIKLSHRSRLIFASQWKDQTL
jgi:hypothetical protein